jgi:hypothetical protein
VGNPSLFSKLSSRFSLRQRWLALGVVLALLCRVGIVIAQDAPNNPATPSHHELAPYAVIFCTVWGPDSHPVYGVHVQLRRAGEKKFRWEAYSDHRGELAFRVPPGKAEYELTADPKSLKALKNKGLTNREPVKVHVEYDEQVDTGLHLTQ